MQQMSLYEQQKSAGAAFLTEVDREAPAYYTSVADEYHAACRGVALRDASARGRLHGDGTDALDLLHRLSSNDLNRLEPGQAANTVLTSNKGRVLDHLRVHRLQDHLLVYTALQSLQRVVEWIDFYTFIEDSAFTDVTDDTAVLQIIGPRAGAFMESLIDHAGSLKPDHLTNADLRGVNVTLSRNEELGMPAYELIVSAGDAPTLWDGLLGAGTPWGMLPMGENAYEVLRIQAAQPRAGAELTEKVDPLAAGLRNSISFTKGCYIGQEVVLRLDTYRKVQRHLVRLELDGEGVPRGGERLYTDEEEKPVGTLTSAVRVPDDGRILGLAYLRSSLARDGATVQVADDQGSWRGTVAVLEQYQREGTGT